MSRTDLSEALTALSLRHSTQTVVKLKTPMKQSIPPKTPPSTPAGPSEPLAHTLDAPSTKAATVFPSHVRTHFRRAPTDFTGELVRLLDDISQVSHQISKDLNKGSDAASPEPELATRKLYTALSHDGYACMLLERHHESPLTFSDTALNGEYVVMLSALDADPSSPEQPVCGTIFSVYKRLSLPSLPGRLKDLQQSAKDQVAAGYVFYSSATTLYYTLGAGVFSFCLHPVATQFFLQSENALKLPDAPADFYGDYDKLKTGSELGSAALAIAREQNGKIFDNGCLVANFHGATHSGGVVVGADLHLLCEAAPLAFLIEQSGGKATNGTGKRILDMAVVDENVHQKVSLCAGPSVLVDAIEAKLQ